MCGDDAEGVQSNAILVDGLSMVVKIENYLSRAHLKDQECPLETSAYGEAREACNIPAILTSDEPPRALAPSPALCIRETALLENNLRCTC